MDVKDTGSFNMFLRSKISHDKWMNDLMTCLEVIFVCEKKINIRKKREKDNTPDKADRYCEMFQNISVSNIKTTIYKLRLTNFTKFRKCTSSLQPDTTCTEQCNKHPEEFIKYICHDHNVLACGHCWSPNIRGDYITDVAKTFKDSKIVLVGIKERCPAHGST